MKANSWATRAAILGLVLLAFGAISASPAFAIASPTDTTLESSQNPSPACGTVTFKATVHGLLLPPLGFVQFFDGASTLGGIQAISIDGGFLGLPTSHSSASISVALSGGVHFISVGYAGTDLPSGDSLVQNVTAATATTVVASTANPSVFGQPVSFTAAVSSSCLGSVAGSVQFQADGSDLGGPQAVDSSGHASIPASDLSVGTHPVTAVFTSSNSDVTGSTGSLGGGQVVNPADTSTGISSSANPSEFGGAVTFTTATTVNSPGGGTPSGSVQFQDNGTNLGLPQSVDSSGHTSIPTANLAVGSHAISAAYTSDSANFNNSSGSFSQTVNKARTTLTYDGATTSDFNDPASLSATLTRTDNSAPIEGKTVTFTMGSESCTQTTAPSGQASCSITPSEAAGPFTVTAAFAGDGNYLSSSAAKPFTVTKEETTTTYTGPIVIAQGSPLTLSGRLLEDGTTAIQGRTLTLMLGVGAGSQSCTTLPTDVAGNGQCMIANVTVAEGSQPVRADFAGDGYYLPSSDATKQVIIFAFPTRGIFVLGDQTIASGPSTVTFWGAQWAAQNTLTGAAAPSSFKGFADNQSSKPPTCGGTWRTSPGNSSSPVETIPAYMGTAISKTIAQSGNTISGNISKIVVVVTAPGYAPDPGHPGTGTIIATYCSSP
jgi:hypothetical protein